MPWYILVPESQSFLFLRVVATGRFQIIIFMKKFGLSPTIHLNMVLGYQVAIFEAGDIHLVIYTSIILGLHGLHSLNFQDFSKGWVKNEPWSYTPGTLNNQFFLLDVWLN